jgi:erythromycin esterase-like protein
VQHRTISLVSLLNMTFLRRSFAAGVVALLSMCIPTLPAGGANSATTKASSTSDADHVVQDLCGKSVAMLGESPLHGFGKTLEFKAALVRRLVEECHYNAFFIESGAYDFLNIQKRLKSGRDVTEPMIAAAIGGLWATREVQPLIPFLLEKAKTGSVTLGGLDDQLARGTYAQHEMPADLVAYLQGDEKTLCLATLQRHTLWQYTEHSPYSPKDRALILGCLESIETILTRAPSSAAPFREYDVAMIDSLKRWFARDFRDARNGVDGNILDFNDRDRSMYLNFEWLLVRLPAHSKVIVWAANTHVAKDLNGVSGENGVVPFGSYVGREFKSHAFALGFSAYSGSYARTGQPVRQLSIAPSDSLETQAFAGRDSATSYLSLKELRKFGSIPGRPLGSSFKTARWGEVLDGVVTFREERAPDFVRH